MRVGFVPEQGSSESRCLDVEELEPGQEKKDVSQSGGTVLRPCGAVNVLVALDGRCLAALTGWPAIWSSFQLTKGVLSPSRSCSGRSVM